MSTERKADIFISYRRDGGSPYAQLVHDRLAAMGFRVQLDVNEGFGSGVFDEKIYRLIEEAQDLVLILAPGTLDRCVHEDDWVRKEILHAIEHKKNIVPFLCPGFVWPKDLPEDIRDVSRYNGVSYVNDYVDAVFEKLAALLHSRPGSQDRPVPPALPPEDPADPIEPDLEIVKEEPSRRGFLFRGYSREDVRRIRERIRERLTGFRHDMEGLLNGGSVPCRAASRAARGAFRVVSEEMALYVNDNVWTWEEDQARQYFCKSYEINVERIRSAAEQGGTVLSEDLVKALRQVARGLDDVLGQVK